jgi:hypothetical protein
MNLIQQTKSSSSHLLKNNLPLELVPQRIKKRELSEIHDLMLRWPIGHRLCVFSAEEDDALGIVSPDHNGQKRPDNSVGSTIFLANDARSWASSA